MNWIDSAKLLSICFAPLPSPPPSPPRPPPLSYSPVSSSRECFCPVPPVDFVSVLAPYHLKRLFDLTFPAHCCFDCLFVSSFSHCSFTLVAILYQHVCVFIIALTDCCRSLWPSLLPVNRLVQGRAGQTVGVILCCEM